ncbi:MAG: hypothetical protein AB8G86_03725 [Saprospiraceae bacterium]
MEKLTQCLNCEWDLPKEENFCPNCDQKNHATRLKVRTFFNELINNITITLLCHFKIMFGLDMPNFKNLAYLVVQELNS